MDKQLPALNTEETSTQPVSPLSTIHSQPNEPVDDIERSSPKPPARTGLAFQDRLTVHQSQMEPFEAATFPQDLVIPPQFAKPTAPTTAPTQITPTAPIADEFLKANSPYRSPSPLYNSPTPGSEHRTPTQADFNPTSYAHPGASLTPKLTSGSSFQPLPPGNPDVNTSNGLFPGQAQGQTERDEASSRRPSKRSTTFSFIGFQDTASEELALHTPTTPDDRSVHRAGAGNTPLRYGIDHDFVSSNQATPERTRRQSSYQPSQYSVAQSGSSREPVHYQEGAAPVHRRPHTSRDPSRDSFNPRHSTTEFEIKGVGPPSEDDMSAKKRSNRLSATWKSLTGSSKSDYEASSVQPSRERQDSAPESPTIEKRKKRRSFFGGGGSSTHAIDSSSKNENDLQYQQQHRSPPRASTEPPDRPRSSNKLQSQSIHKSQRSTISVTPTQEHGKKKRLSSLGVSIQHVSENFYLT